MTGDPVSPCLRFQIMQRDGFRCTYCGRKAATGATLHVDHVVPVASGGGSEDDNLVTSCESATSARARSRSPRSPGQLDMKPRHEIGY